MSNRSKDLLADITTRLKGTSTVTSQLPNGSGDIHPAPVPRPRDTDVDVVVKLIGGSGTRRGRRSQKTRQVQVKLEASSDYFESQPTAWLYDVFDAIEAEMETIGGPARAPDGQGGGLGPEYDDSRGRYVADQTFRYTTVH